MERSRRRRGGVASTRAAPEVCVIAAAPTRRRRRYRYSARSDVFALLTRGAARVYGSVWRDTFFGNRCEEIGLGERPDNKLLDKVCGPLKIRYKWGTECMVTAHLVLRGGVNVTGVPFLTPKIVRPGGV